VWWAVGPVLYYKFAAESVLKELLKSLNIWQSYGGKVECVQHAVQQSTVLLKDDELHSMCDGQNQL